MNIGGIIYVNVYVYMYIYDTQQETEKKSAF